MCTAAYCKWYSEVVASGTPGGGGQDAVQGGVTNIQRQALLYMILLDQGRLAAVDRRLPTVTTIDRFYCT